MARIRSIKPEFWDDEKLAQLPRDVRLLYIGLWNFSDDFGVVKANPIWLKSKIFPYDDIQLTQFKKWLEMLERPGFSSPGGTIAWALRFQVNGEAFYYLSNFSRHQRVEKPSTHNRNPEPPKDIRDWKPTTPGGVGEESGSPPGALPAVLGEGKGEGEGIGKGKGKSVASLHPDPFFRSPDFVSAWDGWVQVRNQGKPKLTDRAQDLNLTEIKKLAGGDLPLAIAIVNQSIARGWKGFFPLKEASNGQRESAGTNGRRAGKDLREFPESLAL